MGQVSSPTIQKVTLEKVNVHKMKKGGALKILGIQLVKKLQNGYAMLNVKRRVEIFLLKEGGGGWGWSTIRNSMNKLSISNFEFETRKLKTFILKHLIRYIHTFV